MAALCLRTPKSTYRICATPLPHHTGPDRTVLDSTVPFRAMPYHAVPCRAVPCHNNALPENPTLAFSNGFNNQKCKHKGNLWIAMAAISLEYVSRIIGSHILM